MSEIERYNGLTPADKGALLDAQAKGNWIARDKYRNGLWVFKDKPDKYENIWASDPDYTVKGATEIDNKTLAFIQRSDAEPANIDLALAQIAEMESKTETNYCRVGDVTVEVGVTTSTPLTWNERINQMTVSEKSDWMKDNDFCIVMKLPEDGCMKFNSCSECLETWLNSPYTEGATDEG